MKNWNIRKKLVPLYLVISFFTFLLFFVALFIMQDVNANSAEEGMGAIRLFSYSFGGYLLVYFLCIFTIGRMVAKQVAYPAKDLVNAAKRITEGDINVELSHNTKDEMGVLTQSFREMTAAIQEQARVLQIIAQGDYTVDIAERGENDVMNKAICEMLDNNNKMVSEIRNAARQVANGAAQISQTSQALASGSTQQAATVEELSASITEVQHQAEENLGLAGATVGEVNEAGRLMGQSMEYMNDMTQAMNKIETSSEEISKVIKVIDDIAFQTNILALNAAVEAARAGQHGKGFAVVADEVRNLASKSADAAKETAALIDNSVENVKKGTGIVEMTGESLAKVGEIAGANAVSMEKMSESSSQQSVAIAEVTTAIGQISQVVQANSATSEESAAATQELNAQAELLNRVVSQFKLREDAGRPGGVPRLEA